MDKLLALQTLWKAAGAVAWGATAVCGLQPYLSESSAQSITALCPGAKTVLVAAFPYYAGTAPGNLSLYCRGEDYHNVLTQRLIPVCQTLTKQHPTCQFYPSTDHSPIPELIAAELAGVGHRGRHGLRIVPPYGSYVFLGTILTDWNPDLPPPRRTPDPYPICPPDCRACLDACPTGALQENGCQLVHCLSHLTQQKGELPPDAELQIRRSPTIWGCDLCQRACPHNHNAAWSPLPEFRENLLAHLTLDDLDGLSNKSFRRQYRNRAFSWRGIVPLKRNLQLKASNPDPPPISDGSA